MDSNEQLTCRLSNGRIVQFDFSLLDKINVNEIVSIDVSNIMGEYIVAPAIFNAIANVKTLLQQSVSEIKLDLNIEKTRKYSRLAEEKRQSTKPREYTNPFIESQVEGDPDVIQMQRDLINAEQRLGIAENLYWAMKEKCSKLDHIFNRLAPNEINLDIAEAQINKLLVRFSKVSHNKER